MSHAPLNTEATSFESLQQPSVQKLQHVFHNTEDWLLRTGKTGIRNFFLGLIRRIKDEGILRRLIVLLSSASQKDFIYTRSRCNPGLPSDVATKSPGKEFSSTLIKKCAEESLKWFQEADDHCRLTYILSVANLCVDTGIAHQACNLCKAILHRRNTELISKQETFDYDIDSYDALSLDSSRYSFHTDDHPDLYHVATIVSGYGKLSNDVTDQDQVTTTSTKLSIINEKDTTGTSPTSRTVNSRAENEYSRTCLITTSYSALSGISPSCDFISLLPVHLSKNILGMLSKKDQSSCALVNSTWRHLVSEVRSDEFHLQIIKEEAILMQGVSASGSNPTLANIRRVLVPVVDAITKDIKRKNLYSHGLMSMGDGEEELFESLFSGYETEYVEVEERNMYCGAYNLLVLDQRSNATRVISYAGQENLVMGSTDKLVRTIDISSGREKKPTMHGHPASITALYMGTKDQGSVYSGSYDTTIRKWNINTGCCQLIMHGHRSSITSIDLNDNILVSGSLDGLVKAWKICKGNCLCTFKHSKKFSVTCVQLRNNIIVSSCERGLVKVWDLTTRRIVKTLNNHGGMKVNCVRFDEHFLLSGGSDDYLLLWSMPGRQKVCLKAYRHPKPVLCLEFKYMCAISGCADGKIRVINILTGGCLRVLRGNSQCDPIIHIFATEDRLLVNTSSNCLVMHFEPVTWEYKAPMKRIRSGTRKEWETLSKRPVSSTILHSVSRAKRLSLANGYDKRVYQRMCSAPPRAMKGSNANTDTTLHQYVQGRRPASHYIELQPEFRRPRSGVSASVMSFRPGSSFVENSSRPSSRLASATSTRRSSVRTAESPDRKSSFPRKVWPSGNKHSTLARDGRLMRLGMLNNAKKREKHNINTEINSISYFDRFYPRRQVSRIHSVANTYPASSSTAQKVHIGKFSTREEEIREIKSVLKEGYSPERKSLLCDMAQKRLPVYFEPILDPLRLGFTFLDTNRGFLEKEKTESPMLHVDQFLHQQLGLLST